MRVAVLSSLNGIRIYASGGAVLPPWPGSCGPRPPPRRDAPPAEWRTNSSTRCCCESTVGVSYTTALDPGVFPTGTHSRRHVGAGHYPPATVGPVPPMGLVHYQHIARE